MIPQYTDLKTKSTGIKAAIGFFQFLLAFLLIAGGIGFAYSNYGFITVQIPMLDPFVTSIPGLILVSGFVGGLISLLMGARWQWGAWGELRAQHNLNEAFRTENLKLRSEVLDLQQSNDNLRGLQPSALESQLGL